MPDSGNKIIYVHVENKVLLNILFIINGMKYLFICIFPGMLRFWFCLLSAPVPNRQNVLLSYLSEKELVWLICLAMVSFAVNVSSKVGKKVRFFFHWQDGLLKSTISILYSEQALWDRGNLLCLALKFIYSLRVFKIVCESSMCVYMS